MIKIVNNSEIEIAWQYHNGTKHPLGFLMNPLHSYNPVNRPNPFKKYRNVPKIKMPKCSKTNCPVLKTISLNVKSNSSNNIPDFPNLSSILYYSSGITKTINFSNHGKMDFRAASCTGALYHIEIYVVCKDIKGLNAGIYHFDPKEMNLALIRKGDFRSVLISACGEDTDMRRATLILVYTDIFTKNSVKYQTREYRHAFWDCGTVIANTLAVCSGHNLPAKVVMGFVDKSVNYLLDLDEKKEVSLALVPIGTSKKETVGKQIEITKLNLKTDPLSSYDFDDPEIEKIHKASALTTPNEVRKWSEKTIEIEMLPARTKYTTIRPLPEESLPQNAVESVIKSRGSTRIFSRESISFEQLSTIIHYSTRRLYADFLPQDNDSQIDLYLIINNVEGIKQGSYFYDRKRNSLQLLKQGNFRERARHLGLDQDLPADGSVSVFLMTNLPKVFDRLGNRGYRTAQMEASIIGGKFYLSSFAHGLGATGLTFYDDSVTEFFSPHAQNKNTMFMVIIGKRGGGLFDTRL